MSFAWSPRSLRPRRQGYFILRCYWHVLTWKVLQVLSLEACGSGLRASGCYGLWIPR